MFDGDKAAERFDILFNGFVIGRQITLHNDEKGQQTREERRADLAVLRALEAISDPENAESELIGGTKQRSVRLGETLVLKQAEFDRLEKRINRAPWDTGKLSAVEDALDFLATAEKVDES
mgnify:CR=1 FL=1